MVVSHLDFEATERLRDDAKKNTALIAEGVGLALSEWGSVEIFMTFVFVAIMDRASVPFNAGGPWNEEPSQRRLAHASFNAIVSFDTRIDVLSATVAESDISDTLKALWPGIASRQKKKYKARHEVAHFVIDAIPERDGSLSVMLTPFAGSVFRYGDKRLTRQHIDHKAEQFREIADALMWFRTEVDRKRRRLKGPRGPEPALIRRVRQSLEIQKRAAQK